MNPNEVCTMNLCSRISCCQARVQTSKQCFLMKNKMSSPGAGNLYGNFSSNEDQNLHVDAFKEQGVDLGYPTKKDQAG